MIPASYRLSSAAFLEKKWIFTQSNSPYFSLKWRRNTQTHFRCAVVVASSVSKKAVDRNRIRRFFYDAVMRHLPPRTPIDVVFYVKKIATGFVLSEIDNSIASSCSRLV